jgi:phosphate starvation-inducible PhoH-like protein
MSKDKNTNQIQIEFDDNSLLPALFGSHDANLILIEKTLGVVISYRGNKVAVSGSPTGIERSVRVLHVLYARLERHDPVTTSEVEAALRAAVEPDDPKQAAFKYSDDRLAILTKLKRIHPRTKVQAKFIENLRTSALSFALGPAGTGKTYLAVAMAVSLLQEGKIDRLILSRPAVEAGEKLGFLPGDLREKVDPYLRPLYDALHDMMPMEQVEKRLEDGEIEVAPLAFMRGRTLSNAFVILDEAQNTTPMQMRMFLTRLGENSRMVVTGDLTQVDLPSGMTSGLDEAIRVLKNVEGVSFTTFTDADVVRHPLVASIVRAYAKMDDKKRKP